MYGQKRIVIILLVQRYEPTQEYQQRSERIDIGVGLIMVLQYKTLGDTGTLTTANNFILIPASAI